MTGSAKASVLPEPVRARPMRSRPACAGSNTCFWMGNSERDVARLQCSNCLVRQPDVGHLHQTSEVRNKGPALYTDQQVEPWSRCSLMHTAHDMQRSDADTRDQMQ